MVIAKLVAGCAPFDFVEGERVDGDRFIETARTWGVQGRAGWEDVWRDTGGRQWQAGLAYVRTQRSAWLEAIR